MKDFLKKHGLKFITIPAIISGVIFMCNVILALQDGMLDDQEIHHLMSSANGIETVLLIIFALIFKKRS